MKARPTWAALVASIAEHPRQMRALSAYRFDASRMKSMTTPTLLLIVEETASPYANESLSALRESLPSATVAVLERQQHNRHGRARDVLSKAITAAPFRLAFAR